MRNVFVLLLVCLMAGSLLASIIPADGDSWTEFSTSSEATDAGWAAANNTASNDHSVIASSDSIVGSYSVGIEANAGATNWQYAGLRIYQTVDISDIAALSLNWKGLGNPVGESFFVRITMSRDAGGTKSVYKSFACPSEWTEMDISAEDFASWTWYNEDNKNLTTLNDILFYTGSSVVAATGDAVLVDGLHFVPEPVSMFVLGLGGLLMSKRRFGIK